MTDSSKRHPWTTNSTVGQSTKLQSPFTIAILQRLILSDFWVFIQNKTDLFKPPTNWTFEQFHSELQQLIDFYQLKRPMSTEEDTIQVDFDSGHAIEERGT